MLRTLGTLCLIGGVASGCGHDHVRDPQIREQDGLALEQNRQEKDFGNEHADRQREQEQEQERAALQRERFEARLALEAAARREMLDGPGATEELRQQPGEELNQDVRDLNALVQQACATVAEQTRKECPLNGERVVAVSNMTDGVRIKLDLIAGPKAAVEERIDCYRARAEIRRSVARLSAKDTSAPDSPTCVLDQPELETEVTEDDGQVALELTTGEGQSSVRELRTQARALLRDDTHTDNTPRIGTNANGLAIRP